MANDTIEKLYKDIEDLKAEVKRLSAQRPLYTVLNFNIPSQLTADVNDYDPGNYDVLRISSNASPRNISGFSGGVTGRFLWLLCFGTNTIALLNQSALSAVGNRISTLGGTTTTMNPQAASGVNSIVVLMYDNGQWRVMLKSAP